MSCEKHELFVVATIAKCYYTIVDETASIVPSLLRMSWFLSSVLLSTRK
jgi:hypothetical protein